MADGGRLPTAAGDLRAVLEAVADAVIMADAGQRVGWLNAAAVRLLGVEGRAVAGRTAGSAPRTPPSATSTASSPAPAAGRGAAST
jgi:PAS domain-containing protein